MRRTFNSNKSKTPSKRFSILGTMGKVKSMNALPVYTMEDWRNDGTLTVKPGQAVTEQVYFEFIENSLIDPWGELSGTTLDIPGVKHGYYTNNENGGVCCWAEMEDGRYVFLGDYPLTIIPYFKELEEEEEQEEYYDNLRREIRRSKDYESIWAKIIEYDQWLNGEYDAKTKKMSKDKEVIKVLCAYQDYTEEISMGNGVTMDDVCDEGSLYYPILDPDPYIESAFNPDYYAKDANGNPVYNDRERYIIETLRKLNRKYA